MGIYKTSQYFSIIRAVCLLSSYPVPIFRAVCAKNGTGYEAICLLILVASINLLEKHLFCWLVPLFPYYRIPSSTDSWTDEQNPQEIQNKNKMFCSLVLPCKTVLQSYDTLNTSAFSSNEHDCIDVLTKERWERWGWRHKQNENYSYEKYVL